MLALRRSHCRNRGNRLKSGFICTKLTPVLVVMTVKWSSQASRTIRNVLKHFFTQHGLKFQECHVFDTLCMSATAFQLSNTCLTNRTYPVLWWHRCLNRLGSFVLWLRKPGFKKFCPELSYSVNFHDILLLNVAFRLQPAGLTDEESIKKWLSVKLIIRSTMVLFNEIFSVPFLVHHNDDFALMHYWPQITTPTFFFFYIFA